MAEALGLLIGFAQWMQALDAGDRAGLVSHVASLTAPLLCKPGGSVRASLQRAAARLLYALAGSVRDPALLASDALAPLLADPCGAMQGCDAEALRTVLRMITAACCLPWAGVQEQQQAWDTRAAHLQRALTALLATPQQSGDRFRGIAAHATTTLLKEITVSKTCETH